ncbi:hypothetical protein D3C72_974960 [compost metagenome]
MGGLVGDARELAGLGGGVAEGAGCAGAAREQGRQQVGDDVAGAVGDGAAAGVAALGVGQ